MGRRLLIQEGRLTYRKHPESESETEKTKADTQVSKRDAHRSHRSQNGGFKFSMFEEITSPTSAMNEVFAISPVTTTSLILPHHQPGPAPAKSTRFVEDEGPEWRELDYILEVGEPPTTFCEFFQQYDWNFYKTSDDLTPQEIEERKNLLNQFRKWKKRKRKTFNIVVTERSRREMAEQEEEKNKKRIPPQK